MWRKIWLWGSLREKPHSESSGGGSSSWGRLSENVGEDVGASNHSRWEWRGSPPLLIWIWHPVCWQRRSDADIHKPMMLWARQEASSGTAEVRASEITPHEKYCSKYGGRSYGTGAPDTRGTFINDLRVKKTQIKLYILMKALNIDRRIGRIVFQLY